VSEKREIENETFIEEWQFTDFIDFMVENTKLVSFNFSGTRVMCVFENFDVLEIDLRSREVVQNCNL